MCISYINRLKSAPKAPKFLGDFGLLIRKPPLVMAAFGTRGGFLIKVTTDTLSRLIGPNFFGKCSFSFVLHSFESRDIKLSESFGILRKH